MARSFLGLPGLAANAAATGCRARLVNRRLGRDNVTAMARIVLFGATGYTGELTARELVSRGAKPVLAARSREKVEGLAAELGGLDSAVADVSDPASVADLVERGDVLVTTVGPFSRFGSAAVEAAIGAGAHYVDSTGEAPFIRKVFEQWGPRAESSGSILLTAFGYDWVPGNYAASKVMQDAPDATQLDIGYFTKDSSRRMKDIVSGGTAASVVDVLLSEGFAYRGGRIVSERTGTRRHEIKAGGKAMTGISAATSEAYSLPRLYPQLEDVNVWIGVLGPASGFVSRIATPLGWATKVPGLKAGLARTALRLGSSGGPSEAARAKSSSLWTAEASNRAGDLIAKVDLAGPNGYTLTGRLIAEAAIRLAGGAGSGAGALGPAEAFGPEGLDELCRATGIEPAS